MPEGGDSNIELAHHLSHRHNPDPPSSAAHEMLEIVEAIVLALVAITTAWSGYQAALWNGHQSELYGIASKLRVEADAAATTANQERLYEASTVVEWIRAASAGNQKLADIFERRLPPEFRPVFDEWKKTDPLNNPHAPIGPQLMPDYRNAKAQEAASLNEQSTKTFEDGNTARRHADQYVRVTVTLATVLLLTSISQRFRSSGVRVGLTVLAVLLLLLPIYRVMILPRA
jgi:hypothetical protein